MSYGIEIRNAANAVVFKMDAEGGLFLGTFDVPATGSNVVANYSTAAGRTAIATPVGQTASYGGNPATDMSLPQIVIDITQGFPRVTATPMGRAATVYVFVQ